MYSPVVFRSHPLSLQPETPQRKKKSTLFLLGIPAESQLYLGSPDFLGCLSFVRVATIPKVSHGCTWSCWDLLLWHCMIKNVQKEWSNEKP